MSIKSFESHDDMVHGVKMVGFNCVFFAATRRTMFVWFQESYECFVLQEV